MRTAAHLLFAVMGNYICMLDYLVFCALINSYVHTFSQLCINPLLLCIRRRIRVGWVTLLMYYKPGPGAAQSWSQAHTGPKVTTEAIYSVPVNEITLEFIARWVLVWRNEWRVI